MSSNTRRVLKYVFFDLMRSKAILMHGAFFLLISWGLLYFSEDTALAIASLLNLVLLLIPLVGFIFSASYFYNSREFLEMLLAQPIDRFSIYFGHYLGLVLPLSVAFLLGVLLPFLFYSVFGNGELGVSLFLLIAIGVFLTFASTGISFFAASLFDDRIRALGVLIAVWVGLTFVYDGIILFISVFLREYPLEQPVLAMTVLNPVDLARIIVMLNLDVAALMGYTGALFQKFLGSGPGFALAAVALLLWSIFPVLLGARSFRRKDF